jgi:3-phenylpropionate/trans-cinnamate dioxygenase ferredoxin component
VAFIRIARAEEVPPGRTAFFRIESKPVLIAHVKGEYYALHGLCAHRNYPLEGATLLGHLVDCPWHHFQYDVRAGENYFPCNVYPSDMPHLAGQLRPARAYPVKVTDGEIWVDLG